MSVKQQIMVDVEDFHERGVAGPFDSGLDPTRAKQLGDRYSAAVTERRVQPMYRRYAQRDWHLQDEELEQLLTSPAIVEPVRRILGPDLLLWRSKIFYKPPGGGPVGWHQEWGSFDGEEIGGSIPSLQPQNPEAGIWDLTVWVALEDVGMDNGPMQFVPGSNHKRLAWDSVPMTESAFFEDPFNELGKAEIVRRTHRNELLLDIDSASWLDGLDVEAMGREALIAGLTVRIASLRAKYTDYHPAPESVLTMPMRAGQFVVFSERTMHGSPANHSDRRRIAVNTRITKADTLVYPERLSGTFIDGSNLDIREHASLLIAGKPLEHRNVWRLPLGAA